jgi:hypothetical protein
MKPAGIAKVTEHPTVGRDRGHAREYRAWDLYGLKRESLLLGETSRVTKHHQ